MNLAVKDARSFESLKARQRKIRDGVPHDVTIRIHRSLSWLQRAELAGDDLDSAFIFYWIAFNAGYAREVRDEATKSERRAFTDYFKRLCRADRDRVIYDVIWQRYSQSIRLLLNNRFVYSPFWKYHNGTPGYDDWEERFATSRRHIGTALKFQDTAFVLSALFDRLYVLRNQLIHGGSTWNSSVNREQVKVGVQILADLVPVFIELMMDNDDKDWGNLYYPLID